VAWQRWNSSTKIFELSTDDGANWAPLGLDAAILTQGIIASIARIATGTPTGAKFVRDDLTLAVPPGTATPTTSASDLTSGTLADARLSSNVPLKNAANVFSAAGNSFSELLAVAKGLSFPATQVASSGANDFDDYEEGSWTPVLGGNGATPTGQSYSRQIGRYIKAARLVVLVCEVSLSNKGTPGGTNLQIQGLPFTTTNITGVSGQGSIFWTTLNSNYYRVGVTPNENSTVLALNGNTAAGDPAAVPVTDLNNSTSIVLGIAYFAES